jgi:dTDP-glucose pyrophosphorylase
MKSISYDYTAQRVRIGDDRPGEVEDEMEDRVLSKKPEIKGFSKYITGVYIPTGLIMEIVASRGGEYEADDLTDVIQKLAGMGVEIYNCSVRGYIDMVKGGDDENAVSMISSDDSNPTFNSKCKTNIDDFIRMVTDMADYYE